MSLPLTYLYAKKSTNIAKTVSDIILIPIGSAELTLLAVYTIIIILAGLQFGGNPSDFGFFGTLSLHNYNILFF